MLNEVLVSPSRFAFFYAQCRRCAWISLNGLRDAKRPADPLPKVFRAIDGAIKAYFLDNRDLRPFGIAGKVSDVDVLVKSEGVQIGGAGRSAHIFGEIDMIADMDDGGVGVFEFKTTTKQGAEDALKMYAPQIEGYRFAIESPVSRFFDFTGRPYERESAKVTAAGIIAYWPEMFSALDPANPVEPVGDAILAGKVRALTYPIEYFDSTESKLLEILEFANGPFPASSRVCEYCRFAGGVYRLSRKHGGNS